MDRSKITILVAGTTASGKSTISEIISQALIDAGFGNVQIVNFDDYGYDRSKPDGKSQAFTRKHLKDALPILKERLESITIEEVGLIHEMIGQAPDHTEIDLNKLEEPDFTRCPSCHKELSLGDGVSGACGNCGTELD